jgi:hypothetical protein
MIQQFIKNKDLLNGVVKESKGNGVLSLDNLLQDYEKFRFKGVLDTINQIGNTSLELLKDLLGESFEEAKQEIQDFLTNTKNMARIWAIDLLSGNIKKESIPMLLEGQKILLEMLLLKIIGEQQIKASKIGEEFVNMFSNKITGLIDYD